MKIKLLTIMIFMVCAPNLCARTRDDVMAKPHEIRVGWADQLFEQMFWHNEMPYVMSESQSRVYKQDYRYLQHYWGEYQYSFAPWFSAGMLVDHSSVHWDNVRINGVGQELSRNSNQKFYNLILMPSIHVSYVHKPHFELYTAFAAGFDINGGTERNEKGRRMSLGYGYDFRPLGVRFNAGPVFSTFDLGRTFALRDSDHVFLAMGRIIAVSVGFNFSITKREKPSSENINTRRDNGTDLPSGYSSHYFGEDDY